MPSPVQPSPLPPPPRPALTNAALPASIALGSLILAIFLPVMLLAVLSSLIWILLVCQKRERIIHDLHADLVHRHALLSSITNTANRIGTIIDASNIPIIATDSEGMITHANPAAEKILSAGRALNATPFDVLFTSKAVLDLSRHTQEGESGHARFTLPIHGQHREFDLAGDPLGDSMGCVFTFRDITELTTAVALKADFAANASHELRTPIASIRAAIDTLNGPNELSDSIRTRMIEMISNNATRLELLVNDLLDLSRIESSDAPPIIEQIDLATLAPKIGEQFATLCARRSVTIEYEISDALGPISTDRTLIALIVRNLIENATKFAREQSVVRVRAHADTVTIDPASPPPSGLVGNSGLILEVIDKGVGIPLGDQQRIFERFYQVDGARSGSSVVRGTGLGLAIVKHSCKRLGGSIRVDSVLGQGTTMRVTLPRCVDTLSEGDDPGE